MSLRNRVVLPIILFALAVLAGCGSSSAPKVTPPPGGSFSNSDLKGTYVFSTSGSDPGGFFFTMAGTITANGSGGITGGTIDINDSGGAGQAFLQAVNTGSSAYFVDVDGRGKIKLVIAPGTITFDFVLSSSAGGMITEFDSNGTGSGTLELQTATVTQTQLAQGYAFSLSGADASVNSVSGAGAFTLGSDGTITTGVDDFNDSFIPIANRPLSGTVTVATGGGSGTAQLTSVLGTLTFDFFVVDATHLKIIETDTLPNNPVLSGEVFQQASMPAGVQVFQMGGEGGSLANPFPLVAAGFLGPLSGAGMTINGVEDVNGGGTVLTQIPFTLTYTDPVNGRSTMDLAGFVGGPTSLAVYPSSGGLLMLEIDSNALAAGTAYAQSATALATPPQGYGLNLSGVSVPSLGGGSFELDDIAEFQTSSTAGPTGLLDQNDLVDGPLPPQGITNNSVITPDASASGRGEAQFNSGSATLFDIIFYTIDGSNVIFIETDSTQIAAGSFQLQSSTGSKAAAVHRLVVRPMILPRAALRHLRIPAARAK